LLSERLGDHALWGALGVADAGRCTLVVAEDHRIEGGLGDAVLDSLAATGPLHGRVVKLGVTQMPGSATPEQLRAWAGIDAASIASRARDVLAG